MQFDNIFLIGMMGSGKSTVAKLLANKIGLPFLDIDNELEKIIDMSINEIFYNYGEKRFRLIESTFFKECSKLNNYIYATGGGIILEKNNRFVLKNRGITFFLDCSVETITKRLENNQESNKRPLINNNFINTIENLYKKRYSLYKSSSAYSINTDLLSPEEVVSQIEKNI